MTARWLFGAALLVGFAAAIAARSSAEDPAARVFHIGVVAGSPRSVSQNVAFEDRLHELGYVEGRNLTIDFVQDNHMDRLVGRWAILLAAASM